MSRQSKKHAIGLAGEFLVAGELQRREIVAAVTYGNAKKADVIAVAGDRAIVIEVKTTSQPKWTLGNHLPEADSTIWVLVYIPKEDSDSPSYYVLTGKELHRLMLPEHRAYLAKYRKKNGKEFTGKGVYSIKRSLLGEEHLSAWGQVAEALGI